MEHLQSNNAPDQQPDTLSNYSLIIPENINRNTVEVEFHGDKILAQKTDDGQILVGLKPIVQSIGLDWEAQRQRIERDSVLSSCTFMIKVQHESGSKQMTALPLEMLNGWLFGIDDSRIQDESVRQGVIRYKKECYSVLYNYFHKGVAVNQQYPDIEMVLEHSLHTIREQRLQLQQKLEVIEQKEQTIKQQEEFIEDAKPKIEEHTAFISAKDCCTFEESAKIMDLQIRKDKKLGKIILFRICRELRFLDSNNNPYQRHIDSGYFITRTKPIWKGFRNGFENVSVPLITPKGQVWLYKRVKEYLGQE